MNHNYSTIYNDISIIPLSKSDSEKYRTLRNAAKEWFVNKSDITYEMQMIWYDKYIKDESELMFSLYYSDQFVGGNSLYNIDKNLKVAEYGRLIVDKGYSGKQFGFQATMGIKKIAKEQLGLEQLYLFVYNNNVSAITTYRKAGFSSIETGNNMIKMRVIL